MAAVTDPNALRFSNTRIRVAADRIAQLYNFIVATANEFTALGMSGVFPNDSSQVLDGAATDGRPQITGADVNNIISIASSLRTTLEATSNQKLNQVLRVGVNTTP
jgi:predicted ATPase